MQSVSRKSTGSFVTALDRKLWKGTLRQSRGVCYPGHWFLEVGMASGWKVRGILGESGLPHPGGTSCVNSIQFFYLHNRANNSVLDSNCLEARIEERVPASSFY